MGVGCAERKPQSGTGDGCCLKTLCVNFPQRKSDLSLYKRKKKSRQPFVPPLMLRGCGNYVWKELHWLLRGKVKGLQMYWVNNNPLPVLLLRSSLLCLCVWCPLKFPFKTGRNLLVGVSLQLSCTHFLWVSLQPSCTSSPIM